MADKKFNMIMALLMCILAIVNIIFGNSIAGAVFWVASAIFNLTSEIPIKLKIKTKEDK